MISYLLEILAFQLAFLLAYDLFLKKETFFQWNRAYLLVTFVLSLVLPWIKVGALKTTVPQDVAYYPSLLFQLEGVEVGEPIETSFWDLFSVWEWIFLFGAAVMTLWLCIKLYQIYRLKQKGSIRYYPEFIKISVQDSKMAFSFFKNVFIGMDIPKEKESNILAHELVHIKQWHSLDLLFFELMRIVFWFNPLVYVYQNRVAELHEFIADSVVAKNNKKEQYQLLLSEAFQTQNLSFVNQFFKKSLIKKRIIMIQKQKSKAIYQFKYLLLIPLVLGMLVCSSCEHEPDTGNTSENEKSLTEKLADLNKEIKAKDSLTVTEREEIMKMTETMLKGMNQNAQTKDGWKVQTGTNFPTSAHSPVPFAVVDEVPVYPGCENASDKKACFQEKIQEHVRKHFNYPKEAQEMGIQGQVAVLFTIDTDGSIIGIRKRGPHELLENEVERIIKRLPKMQPGKQDGKAVKVPFSIPVTFKLK